METISRHLDDLTAFHVVATAGSFTQAAEQLGWSKALLSKQVRRIEASIGSQLFHRTTRSVRLTEEGAVLLIYSQKIFDLSNEATRRLRHMTQGLSGHVRLSVPISFGDIFCPSFLSHVKTKLPHVKFEMDLSNESVDFSKERIDFSIRASEDRHPDLIAKYLGRIKDVICVSHSFLAKSKITDSPTSIVQHECILNSLNTQWNTWTFQSKAGELRIEVSGNYATNQYRMARNLCIDGFGVAKLPLYMVADDLKSGNLVQLFPDYEITTHPLYLIYLKNEYTSKKHKLIKDSILYWFKQRKEYFI